MCCSRYDLRASACQRGGPCRFVGVLEADADFAHRFWRVICSAQQQKSAPLRRPLHHKFQHRELFQPNATPHHRAQDLQLPFIIERMASCDTTDAGFRLNLLDERAWPTVRSLTIGQFEAPD